MKRLILISVILVLAFSLILGSCGESTTEEPTTTQPTQTQPTSTEPTKTEPTKTEPTKTEPTQTQPTGRVPTGTITAASVDFGWESTDPVYYESLWGWAFYDALVRYDEGGRFTPHVAESWTIEDNVFTFKIKKGIKWHDGSPLTAHDVKFSIDRFGDMSLSTNPWSWYISEAYNKADSIVVDDYTYQFVSDHAEPAQMIIFAWTRILPKDYYERVGMDEFRLKPMGSGPWKLIELIPETSMTLEANADYWIPDEVPYYQYYTELQVPEQATRIAMLKTGEVDMAFGIDYDRVRGLLDDGFASVYTGFPTLNNYTYQGTWLPDAGPTGDIRVRQAMSYALDRQEISDTWYDGFAIPGGNWFTHEGAFGWTDEMGVMDPYDPAKAAALLAEAGYPDAFDDPVIHFYTTPAGQDFILLLFDYWQDAGIQMQLEVVDATVNGAYFFNFTRLVEGDPNVGWMFFWGFGSTFNNIYHSSNMFCSWGTHNSGNDPELDRLYLRGANEVDATKQEQYWAEFMLYAKSQYINVGIVTVEPVLLYNPETIGQWTGRNWVSYADALNGVMHP